MARSYIRAHKDSSSGVALAGVKEFIGAGHARENEMKFKCGYPGSDCYYSHNSAIIHTAMQEFRLTFTLTSTIQKLYQPAKVS
jgi:hypothetical protein